MDRDGIRIALRMPKLQWVLPICAAAAFASPVQAASLKKNGAWVATNEVDGCHLTANFGTGRQVVTAQLTRYQPGEPFELRLIGSGLLAPRRITITKLNFGLGATDRAPTMVGVTVNRPTLIIPSVRLDGWRARTAFDSMPAISPGDEARVNALTFEVHNGERYQLELGSMQRPMAALRECTDRLVAHWGYDPGQQARLQRRVTPTNETGTWLGQTDFPPDALKARENGIVHFRLDVGESGQVLGCHVIARTEPNSFADTTCRLVTQRATLLPALDESGKPIRSYHVQTVRWQARSY